MIKTTLQIDGMMCGMCEAHVQETIRKSCPAAKKVSASHGRGEATFHTETPLAAAETENLQAALAGLGYRVLAVTAEPVEKKKPFWRK